MKARYTIGNIKVNNSLFTDNLLSTVHAISKDIDLDYGIMKCGMLVFKKVVKREGIKLSDGQVVKEIGEESYKYMETVEYNKIIVWEQMWSRVKFVLKAST